ncbi:reverse transcriptase [Lasius niger]|uniref:Reverse transcriptase n=1 Tax=Lasius niger TaxID=67767 RepID=A0A0J7KFA5_LASNI|nr:reverse transcriptase [Lasius niger]
MQRDDYARMLGKVGRLARRLSPRPVIVAEDFNAKETVARRREKESRSKQWALRKLDGNAFMASIQCALMTKRSALEEDLEGKLHWVLGTMETACEASMPRTKFQPPKKGYWESEQIAELRQKLVRAKRRAIRCRNREGHDETWGEYRSLRDELRKEIRVAKAKSWGELLSSLDRDPWGRPYKLVLGKLKQAASPVTEAINPLFVRRVIDTRFPEMEDGYDDPIPEREVE